MKQRLLVLFALMLTIVFGARAGFAGPTGWYPAHGLMPSDPQGDLVHNDPSVVALADQRILVIGGEGPRHELLRSVDIFDPASRTWRSAAPLPVAQRLFAALLLGDGRVLVAGAQIVETAPVRGDLSSGGPRHSIVGEVDIYDPSTDTWTEASPLPEALANAAAVVLRNGNVLVAGGQTLAGDRRTTFFYDPLTDTWTAGPELEWARSSGTLTLLEDGRALLSGGTLNGFGLAAAEYFVPAGNVWKQAGRMSTGRTHSATGLLADGRVIVVGGSAGGPSNADVFDPVTGKWQLTSAMNVGRVDPVGGLLRDGTFMVAGGTAFRGATRSAERYDPATDTWTLTSSMSETRGAPGAAVIDGDLFVAGGGSATAEIYIINHAPVAVATVQASALGFPASGLPGDPPPLAPIAVSGAASSDADGDALTFTWSENGVTLAVTADPTRTAFVALPIGTHTLTLTVSDGFGGVSTTSATAAVMDGTQGYADQIRDLSNLLTQMRSDLQSDVAAITQVFRRDLNDPSFTVPGSSPDAQLQAIVNGILSLPMSAKIALYNFLKTP
jgi:hypothetical protein